MWLFGPQKPITLLFRSLEAAFIWSNTVQKSTIFKHYYNLKLFSTFIYFKMSFIPVMQSWISSSQLLQSSVSHNPSEII